MAPCSPQGPTVSSANQEVGPTLHAVFYFALWQQTMRALKNGSLEDQSLRLPVEYFRLFEKHLYGSVVLSLPASGRDALSPGLETVLR